MREGDKKTKKDKNRQREETDREKKKGILIKIGGKDQINIVITNI